MIRRRYRAHHVGRIREKLAEMIVAELAKQGVECRAEPENLRPQQGAWRTDHRLDVCRWEGRVSLFRDEHWSDVSIMSWSTMSDCVRFGIDVEPGEAPWWLDVESKDTLKDYRRRIAA